MCGIGWTVKETGAHNKLQDYICALEIKLKIRAFVGP